MGEWDTARFFILLKKFRVKSERGVMKNSKKNYELEKLNKFGNILCYTHSTFH